MKQRVDAQRQAQIQADIQTWTNQIVPAWSDKSLSSPIVIKLCARAKRESCANEKPWDRAVCMGPARIVHEAFSRCPLAWTAAWSAENEAA